MFSNDATTPIVAILSILSFVVGPLLCARAVWFSVVRRRKPGPLILAVIPLALTSVSIQLTAATLMIVSGFGGMAQQKSTGAVAVSSVLTAATAPLLWRFVEVAACILIASPVVLWLHTQDGKELRETLNHSSTTIALSAATLVSVICLVWFYRDIVELCTMLIDPCRVAEARAELGDLGIPDVAAMLSSRLVIFSAFASLITFCMIGIGFRCLQTEEQTEWGIVESMSVAIVALAWCGISISTESRAQVYLTGIAEGSSRPTHIYHTYSRTMIGYVLRSRVGSTGLDHSHGVQLPTSSNSHRLVDADRDDAVILTVTREGQLPQNPVDLITVAGQVKDRLANRLDKTVYVRADASARYGTVAEVFGQLRTAGVDIVGLLTSGTPRSNLCATSGFEVVIPEPLLSASDSARQRQDSQSMNGVLREPAILPTSTGPTDPVVIQVVRASGGVQWKINGTDVSGLNDLTAQLESLLRERQERVGFLMADENLQFSDFVDALDAGIGAGLDKVAVLIETPDENNLRQRGTVIGFDSGPTQPIDRTYSRFGIDSILDYFREPPPPKVDLILAPPPPPPPPPAPIRRSMGGVLGSIASARSSVAAPRKIATPQRVRVSSNVAQGFLVQKVSPTYPPLARQARIQGTVVLQAQISKFGDIENLQLVSGHPMLAPAAIEAVKQWKYKPYLLNGEPVEVETTVQVNFTLAGS
jgi:TonB family protein